MRRAGILAPLLLGTVLSACVAGPPPVVDTPPPTLPAGFRFEPPPATAASVAGLLPVADSGFLALADMAQANAPGLLEAMARVEQARAQAARAGANRGPNIGANLTARGERTNPDQFGADLPPGIEFDTTRATYGANLSASWDPDIFGRLRAAERAALARGEAASWDADGVRLALMSEVAGAVIDWRSLSLQEEALRRDLDAAAELARLAGVREKAGIAPGFDRLRAEAAAAASRSRIDALASERGRIMGRLVTLTAVPASEVLAALGRDAPLVLPPAPAALPAQLLANRPDVLAASARLAAADADLAAAAAERFPRFDLSATIGLLAFGIGGLFDDDALVGSVAAGLGAPLFDSGRIAAEIDGAAAGKGAAFEAYRGTIWQALGDAETGYALIAAADREAEAAEAEAQLSARNAQLADIRYRAGLSDFLTVLEARRSADGADARAAAALGRAARARILLWQALGGSDLP